MNGPKVNKLGLPWKEVVAKSIDGAKATAGVRRKALSGKEKVWMSPPGRTSEPKA